MDPLSLIPDRSISLGAMCVRIVDVPRLFAEEAEAVPQGRAQTMWLQLAAALRRRLAAQDSPMRRRQLRGLLIEPQKIAGLSEIG